MELGPGVRAITVDSPYTVDRYRLFDGTTVLQRNPLTLRADGSSPHVVGFDPCDGAFTAPAGVTVLGWLTRVDVVVLSGAATLVHAAGDLSRTVSQVELEPGVHHVDLLLDDSIRGASCLFGARKQSGATRLSVLGFACSCLVDEERPARAEGLPASLALVPRWSQHYGDKTDDLAARIRQIRYSRFAEPRPMPWLEGLELVIAPDEQISRAVYVSGLYEPCTAFVLREILEPGATFVDVGANIGLLTMLASRWVGETGSVVSFEPSQREFDRLRRHIDLNSLGNVHAVRAAVGREEGTAVLRVADVQLSGLNTLEPRFMYANVDQAYTETVPVVRLDDFVTGNALSRVHVIKVDVEGGEHDVIAGARETIARDRPALLLEIAGAASAPGHQGRLGIEALLGSLGYELVAIDGETGTLRRVTDLTSAAENFLAAQPEAIARLHRAAPDAGLLARPVGYDRPHMDRDSPYVSVILTGRNDDFGGDFNDRMFRALEFNHRHLADRGIPHEFVFCEWRPVAGKPWLAEVLADRYPNLVPHVLTSFVADVAYHEAYSLNPRLQFQEFIAKNIGIRRCRGAYLLTTNTDVYLSRGVLDLLERRALEPRVVYRAPRVDLKDGIDCEQLDFSVLEDPRNEDTVNEIRPPLYTNASGDFLLLDRDSYTALRGFNEVYRVAKVHMDSNFCLKAYSSGLALRPIDAPVYHVGRGTLNSQQRLYSSRPQDAPWGDRRWKHGVLYDNDPNWGLAQAPMRTVRPGVHYLAFSWAAVPPPVALNRVVLPVERTDTPSALPDFMPAPAAAPAKPGAPPYPISVTHRDIPIDADRPLSDQHVFDDGLAVSINRARLDFLASLDLPWDGKRVLDAGCGVGHHTSFYVSHGCRVVGIDGRPENIAAMKRLYPDVEGLTGDLQEMDLGPLGPFDIVHCFGLLYHLDSPVSALRKLANVCREYLILETMVCDAKAPMMMLADEQLSANQALAGLACRPSPSFVAMALDRIGFPFVYGTTAPPRHPDFEFEWQDNHDIARSGRNLRCMFVASRRPVACGHLVELVGGVKERASV